MAWRLITWKSSRLFFMTSKENSFYCPNLNSWVCKWERIPGCVNAYPKIEAHPSWLCWWLAIERVSWNAFSSNYLGQSHMCQLNVCCWLQIKLLWPITISWTIKKFLWLSGTLTGQKFLYYPKHLLEINSKNCLRQLMESPHKNCWHISNC